MKIEKYRSNLDYSYTIGIQLTLELLKLRPNDVMSIYLSSVITSQEEKEIQSSNESNVRKYDRRRKKDIINDFSV